MVFLVSWVFAACLTVIAFTHPAFAQTTDSPVTPAKSIHTYVSLPNGDSTNEVRLRLYRRVHAEVPAVSNIPAWTDDEGRIWQFADNARWGNGQQSLSAEYFAFDKVKPGEYRVVANFRSDTNPTPYGASDVIVVANGNEDLIIRADLWLQGTTPLKLSFVDEETGRRIPALYFRLYDPIGIPLQADHLRTDSSGLSRLDQLKPGQYKLEVLKREAYANDFVEYAASEKSLMINVVAGKLNAETIQVTGRRLSEEEISKRFPFSMFGKVADEEGQPMEGVDVVVYTGSGTMFESGRVTTDHLGQYRIYFHNSVRMMSKEYAPMGVGMQGAFAYARKEGYCEKNLSQQGELWMTDHPVEQVEEKDRPTRVFPYQSKEVNFTMAKAATIRGRLLYDSRGAKEEKLTLAGKDLPPGHSVFDSTISDNNGRFEIKNVPLNREFHFEVRPGFLKGVISSSFRLERADTYEFEVTLTSRKAEVERDVTLHLEQQIVERPPASAYAP